MHFQRGRFLRRRYANLLEPDYSPDKIQVRSTDTQRTYESAQYNTAGIFAPADVQWQDALQWQPVSISVPLPYDEDYFLVQSNTPSCKLVDNLRPEYLQSPEIQAQLNASISLRTYLEENSGSTVQSIDDFYQFYDPLNLENMMGLPYVFL